MTTPQQHMPVQPADMPRGIGNCGIVAVAMMANITHSAALAALEIDPKSADGCRGRGRSKPLSLPTYQHQRVKALRGLGLDVEVAVWAANGAPRHRLTWWVQRLAKGRNFMVRVNRHVVVVRDGLVYDQGNAGVDVQSHFSRNQIVTDIAYVVGPKERLEVAA